MDGWKEGRKVEREEGKKEGRKKEKEGGREEGRKEGREILLHRHNFLVSLP